MTRDDYLRQLANFHTFDEAVAELKEAVSAGDLNRVTLAIGHLGHEVAGMTIIASRAQYAATVGEGVEP